MSKIMLMIILKILKSVSNNNKLIIKKMNKKWINKKKNLEKIKRIITKHNKQQIKLISKMMLMIIFEILKSLSNNNKLMIKKMNKKWINK